MDFKAGIVDLTLERSRSAFLVLLAIVIFGVVARNAIPVESRPSVEVPYFVITIAHEGISPEDAKRMLIMPLEIELKSVEGVKEVSGTGVEHLASVSVEFDAAVDLDRALADVREALNRARTEFPSTAEEPVLTETATSDIPVLQVNLIGENTFEHTLYSHARRLRDRLESLSLIMRVGIQGNREEFLEVVIAPSQLYAHEVSLEQLSAAIVRNNRVVAAGSMDAGEGTISLKVPSLFKSAQDLLDLPITTSGDTVVTLEDVTTVRRTFKDRQSYSVANGIPSMSLFVHRRAGVSGIEAVAQAREEVERFRQTLPNSVSMFYSQDTSEFDIQQVTELQGNMVTALVLVMIVVVIAMGMRSSLIVGAAVPVSILFALIFLWLTGETFNFMVMFGMLLALGMLIDGAIVVAEYADKQIARGIPRAEAYAGAAKRMFWPVTASTATTLAAFFPLVFWPGTAGEFMGYLPVAVFWVLLGSVVYAIIFLPLLGAYLGGRSGRPEGPLHTSSLSETEDLSKLKGVTAQYAKVLRLATKYSAATLVLTVVVVWGIFRIHGSQDLGILFFNENDPQFAQVFVRARGNLDVDETRALVSEVEDIVLDIPGIKNVNSVASTGLGRAEGQHLQYKLGEASDDLVGTMYLELYGSDKREKSGAEIFEELRRRANAISGIVVEIRNYEGPISPGKPIQIQFTATEGERLVPIVQKVRDFMQDQVEGLRDIVDTIPTPGVEWKLEVDRAKASQYGVDVSTIGLATQLVTNGVKLGEYRPDDADDALDIRIRYPSENRGVEELDELRVASRQGLVPISNFVKREAVASLSSTHRRDQKDVHVIMANVAPGVLADTKVGEIQAWIEKQDFDPEVSIRFRGANEEQEESIAFVIQAFSFAILLMFILLVTQFNSVYQSFLILIAVVFSTAGVFLGLLILSKPFSAILSGVGVVALAGIVVNNNIVLIDSFNVIRRENPDLDVATCVEMTGVQRFRPVMLTTITTVVGLLPLASYQSIDLINRTWVAGGQLSSYWAPLAQAIVFGLSFATVLTLLTTPAMLMLGPHTKNFGQWLYWRLGIDRAASATRSLLRLPDAGDGTEHYR